MEKKDAVSGQAGGSLVTQEKGGALAVMDFGADANMGYEGAGAKCYAVPLLYILQDLSSQVKKRDPEYIEGAEAGMFYNNVTRKLFGGAEGLTVIQVYMKHSFNLWVPRDEGGGFRGELTVAEGEALLRICTRNDKGHDIIGGDGPFKGLQLVDTRTHYLIVLHKDGTLEPIALPLTSTGIAESKKWMTNSQNLTQSRKPIFSQKWKITTTTKSNAQGEWFVVRVEHLGELTVEDLGSYGKAKEFYGLISSGGTKDAQDELPF